MNVLSESMTAFLIKESLDINTEELSKFIINKTNMNVDKIKKKYIYVKDNIDIDVLIDTLVLFILDILEDKDDSLVKCVTNDNIDIFFDISKTEDSKILVELIK